MVTPLRARSDGLANVRFIAQVPQEEIGRHLQQADVLLVHLKNDPLFAITVPSKIQFYLATGKPILAGVAGDASALVQRSGAGLTFEPENVDALMKGIGQLEALVPDALAAMGRQGRRFYQQELSLQIAANRLESILASTLDASRRKRL